MDFRPNLNRRIGVRHSPEVEGGKTHFAARKVHASSRFRTGRSITCSGSGTVEESATLVGQTHNLLEDVPASCRSGTRGELLSARLSFAAASMLPAR